MSSYPNPLLNVFKYESRISIATYTSSYTISSHPHLIYPFSAVINSVTLYLHLYTHMHSYTGHLNASVPVLQQPMLHSNTTSPDSGASLSPGISPRIDPADRKYTQRGYQSRINETDRMGWSHNEADGLRTNHPYYQETKHTQNKLGADSSNYQKLRNSFTLHPPPQTYQSHHPPTSMDRPPNHCIARNYQVHTSGDYVPMYPIKRDHPAPTKSFLKGDNLTQYHYPPHHHLGEYPPQHTYTAKYPTQQIPTAKYPTGQNSTTDYPSQRTPTTNPTPQHTHTAEYPPAVEYPPQHVSAFSPTRPNFTKSFSLSLSNLTPYYQQSPLQRCAPATPFLMPNHTSDNQSMRPVYQRSMTLPLGTFTPKPLHNTASASQENLIDFDDDKVSGIKNSLHSSIQKDFPRAQSQQDVSSHTHSGLGNISVPVGVMERRAVSDPTSYSCEEISNGELLNLLSNISSPHCKIKKLE